MDIISILKYIGSAIPIVLLIFLLKYFSQKKLVKSIISPFQVVLKHKIETFLWVLYVIVAGQLGTLINIIRRVIFGGWRIDEALCPDAESGSFYTFALAVPSFGLHGVCSS